MLRAINTAIILSAMAWTLDALTAATETAAAVLVAALP
jgi:hypothetical protein